MAISRDKESLDVSGTHLWLVMMKAYWALARVAGSSIRSTGFGRSDFGVLEILLHKGPQPVNDVGQRIGLTSGAITTAIDRLEGVQLVTREAHPTDRRARVVRLTKEGRRRVTHAFADHRAAMDEVGSALSTSERATLIRLLKKLGGAAAQMASQEEAEE